MDCPLHCSRLACRSLHPMDARIGGRSNSRSLAHATQHCRRNNRGCLSRSVDVEGRTLWAERPNVDWVGRGYNRVRRRAIPDLQHDFGLHDQSQSQENRRRVPTIKPSRELGSGPISISSSTTLHVLRNRANANAGKALAGDRTGVGELGSGPISKDQSAPT